MCCAQGEPGDTTLLDLLPFLEMVVKTHAPDTRQIVKSYDGTDLVPEFKSRMQQLREQKAMAAQASSGASRAPRFSLGNR